MKLSTDHHVGLGIEDLANLHADDEFPRVRTRADCLTPNEDAILQSGVFLTPTPKFAHPD